MKGSIVSLFSLFAIVALVTLSFGSERAYSDNGYTFEISQDILEVVTLDAESNSVSYGDVYNVACVVCFSGNDANLVRTDLAFWSDKFYIRSHKPNDLFLGSTYDLTAVQFT